MKLISILILFSILSFSKLYANQNEFLKWKNKFKTIAIEKGVSENTFDIVMKDVKFLPKVIEYDRYQP